MFISEKRKIVFTQFEHSRLAGLLAFLWGNENFLQPKISFDSFVLGVTFHDRGYGPFDNFPIGKVSEVDWLELQWKGFVEKYSDPITNLVIQFHLKRLVSYHQTPQRNKLIAKMERMIVSNIKLINFSRVDFEQADTIMALCDAIAFDVCSENNNCAVMEICRNFENADFEKIEYSLEKSGQLSVKPWPFRVNSYQCFLQAYQLDGYPDRLKPVIVPLELKPYS